MMLFWESLCNGLDALLKQKKRTVLTMTGFAFGVALVIVIFSLGNAAGEVMKLYYADVEDGKYLNVMITSGYDTENVKQQKVSSKQCETFNSELPDYVYGISFTTDESYGSRIYYTETGYYDVFLGGVSAATQHIYQLQLACGRFITNQDCIENRSTLVIPDKLAENLYGDEENALGKAIRITGNSGIVSDAVIVGVFKELQSDRSESLKIYAPYTYVNIIHGIETEKEFANLKIAYRQGTINEMNAITYCYDYFQKLFSDDTMMVQVSTSYTQSEDAKKMVDLITMMFVIVSGIVFLVSGIGLVNTLLVSVSERTPEIGIRKALGAPEHSIKQQFIAESCVICTLGCVLGIAMGYAIDIVFENHLEKLLSLALDEQYSYIIACADIQLQPTMGAIVFVVVISLFLGVVFGGYPARKAMRMQPIDALRYE